MTIWKFPLPVGDTIVLKMPVDAKPRYVDAQQGQPCLWAEVDESKPVADRTFYLRGTGHPFTGAEGAYIGSFMLRGGALVFHLYDCRGQR